MESESSNPLARLRRNVSAASRGSRDSKYGSDPITDVFVSVHFMKISAIRTKDQHFDAEIQVKARWQCPRELQEKVQLDLADGKAAVENKSSLHNVKFWKPRIVITNLTKTCGDKYYEKFGLINDLSGNYFINQTISVSGSFFEKMELHDFPYDIQDLSLVLSSESSHRVRLMKDEIFPSRLNHSLFQEDQAWTLYRHIAFYHEQPDPIRSNFLSVFTLCSTKEKTENISHIHNPSGGPQSGAHDGAAGEAGGEVAGTDGGAVRSGWLDEERPLLAATIRVARKTRFYFWNTYIIMGSLAVISLAVFVINKKRLKLRLWYLLVLLLTTVTFKLSLGKELPIIQYLTLHDYYVFFIIIFQIGNTFLICGQYIYSTYAAAPDLTYKVKRMTFDEAMRNGYLMNDRRDLDPHDSMNDSDRALIITSVSILVLFHIVFMIRMKLSTRLRRVLLQRLDKKYAEEVKQQKTKLEKLYQKFPRQRKEAQLRQGVVFRMMSGLFDPEVIKIQNGRAHKTQRIDEAPSITDSSNALPSIRFMEIVDNSSGSEGAHRLSAMSRWSNQDSEHMELKIRASFPFQSPLSSIVSDSSDDEDLEFQPYYT